MPPAHKFRSSTSTASSLFSCKTRGQDHASKWFQKDVRGCKAGTTTHIITDLASFKSRGVRTTSRLLYEKSQEKKRGLRKTLVPTMMKSPICSLHPTATSCCSALYSFRHLSTGTRRSPPPARGGVPCMCLSPQPVSSSQLPLHLRRGSLVRCRCQNRSTGTTHRAIR